MGSAESGIEGPGRSGAVRVPRPVLRQADGQPGWQGERSSWSTSPRSTSTGTRGARRARWPRLWGGPQEGQEVPGAGGGSRDHPGRTADERGRPGRAAAHADDLYELVSERQGQSLIITSNRASSDWYPLFPNPVVAESLLDRLINTSHQVIMNGPSYRPNKRPKNPTDKPAKPPVR
ncbi:ATP-binding protein [Streptomyces sp. NPDC058086]|uniref:ATP-binding protein n=1 Tax=Streptomyces sp. NPDC058086 TaxID=3346334 RepID=UPI0036EA4395